MKPQMGGKKARQNEQTKDTGENRAGYGSALYLPNAEDQGSEKEATAKHQLSRKRQENPRKGCEGKAKAAEKQGTVTKNTHGGSPFGFFTQIIPQTPACVNRKFMQKVENKFVKNSCNQSESMV
ncbi:MAG: hypothetical protein J6B24_14195 [Clostridia bacterium]|nr:hypothetical protein [Clostridia bacterium]